MALASQAKATPREETYTHGEDNRDQRAFPTSSGGIARKFLGRFAGADAAGGAEVFRWVERAAARLVHGEPALRALSRAAGLPQRILRTRFCDQIRYAAAARGAHPQAGLPARGGAEVSAPRRGRHAADPGGVSARH